MSDNITNADAIDTNCATIDIEKMELAKWDDCITSSTITDAYLDSYGV